MDRLFLINTGLQPGVRMRRNEQLFQQFVYHRKAAKAASVLLCFCTRLKPGVNERAIWKRRLD